MILTDRNVFVGGVCVRRPQGDFVALRPDVHDGATDHGRVVAEPLANQTEQELQPQVVQLVHPVVFVQRQHPSAAVDVPRLLPHGLDFLLEEAVVAPARSSMSVTVRVRKQSQDIR